MTAMTTTVLGMILLTAGVLVLGWGFPNLPRR
jgi:hypothetical protein